MLKFITAGSVAAAVALTTTAVVFARGIDASLTTALTRLDLGDELL